jgi:hypothetical protein
MRQSWFREADGHSAGQEIPYLVWNPKIGNSTQQLHSDLVKFTH